MTFRFNQGHANRSSHINQIAGSLCIFLNDMAAKYSFVFALVLGALPLFAQHEGDTLYIKPGNYLLEEMIISGNRWERSEAELAAKLSKVYAAEIQFQNPQTAADLLGLSKGVYIQKSQLAGGSPVVRGFATNRVLLVVDGVRLNNAIFRGGNVQNVISLDAHSIAEAEVIFGPGSVLYGSDAIGGVLDFHTIAPAKASKGESSIKTHAVVRYSSATSERSFHADATGRAGDWAFVSSVTRSFYDDLRMGRNGSEWYTRPDFAGRQNNQDVVIRNPNPNIQTPGGYDQTNLLQKVIFYPGTKTAFLYSFHYSETSGYARYDRLLLRNDDGTLRNAEWVYGPQKWQMHSLTVTTGPRAFFDNAKLITAFQRYGESRHTRTFNGLNRNNRFEQVNAFSTTLDLDKKLTGRSELFYGAEVVLNKVSSKAYREDIVTGDRNAISTRYPDGSKWKSYAIYASVKNSITTKWILNSSVRITHVALDARFDPSYVPLPFQQARLRNQSVNGSVGLTHHANSGIKWYANLSSGFRAPNIDDIGKVFDSSPGLVVVPNDALKPEYAYNIETGVATDRDKKVHTELTGYYTLLSNAITRADYSLNGLSQIEYDGILSRIQALQNVSSIRVYGFQAALAIRLNAKWRLSSTANFQEGKDRAPGQQGTYRPAHVMPFFGNTALRFSAGKFKAEMYAEYNAAVLYRAMPLTERADEHLYVPDHNGRPYAPSWYTINLKSSLKVNQYLTLDLGIENIADKRYRPFSSGITAPGRNFIGGLRGRF
jgi:hemoglobin/transferrin/lactoferrin receptor protein